MPFIRGQVALGVFVIQTPAKLAPRSPVGLLETSNDTGARIVWPSLKSSYHNNYNL